MNCKNCKHWKWWPGFEDRDTKFAFKPCDMEDMDLAADDRAMVFNSIDSYIVTGPNFGCIHFAATEAPIRQNN